MSRCLAERSIDHVVIERGEVANSWKTERWDSLRLLTPNWQSRLPGFGYEGDDPDGYRTMPEVIDFIDRYARVISAPVRTNTKVVSVRRRDEGARRNDAGYVVVTDRGDWHGRTVVLATGACNIARVPAVAAAVPPAITMLTSMQYRNPDQLEPGGVLVVRRVGNRYPAGRRDPALGPASHHRGGRAHPGAPGLPGQGHRVVDGRRRRARRTLRRD